MATHLVDNGFIPQMWDATVYRTLEDNLVAKKICKMQPIKAPKGINDTVYFNGLGDPTIAAYDGTITHEDLVMSQMALLINQTALYAFKVQDIDAIMSNVDLKGSQAARAGYKTAEAIDDFLLGASDAVIIAGAGSTATADTDCDSTTILSDISELVRLLEQQNVRDDNMWCVIPPWVKQKLMLAGIKFSINEGINGTGGMAWTDELGIDIYVSNNVYNSNTVASPVSTVCAGSYDAVAYADFMLESRSMPLEGSRAVALDGVTVYGAKVVKPMELAKIILTYTAETAI